MELSERAKLFIMNQAKKKTYIPEFDHLLNEMFKLYSVKLDAIIKGKFYLHNSFEGVNKNMKLKKEEKIPEDQILDELCEFKQSLKATCDFFVDDIWENF